MERKSAGMEFQMAGPEKEIAHSPNVVRSQGV